MKLAFCLFNYFPFGGLQRDFMRVATLALAKGHEIHVHTMDFVGDHPSAFVIHTYKPSFHVLQNHSRAYQFAQRIQDACKGKYDRVIGFNKMPGLDVYYAADGCFKAKLSQLNLPSLQSLLPRNKTYLALEEAVFGSSSHAQLVFIAKQNKIHYQHHYPLSSERQFLLPPGIDCSFQALPEKETVCQSLRQQLGLQKQDIVLLMVASRFKTKGLDRAIKAISSLPQSLQKHIQFIVIGNDDQKPFIRLANELSVTAHINFVGAQENIAHWMQAADLLLHPAYYESAGLTLLEAIASGLPILTTASCGYAEYVLNANAGKVVPDPYSQDCLNQILLALLLSPPDLKNYGVQARRFAEQADFYNMPSAMLDMIENWNKCNANSYT